MPSERVQTFLVAEEARRVKELAARNRVSVSSMTSLLVSCAINERFTVLAALVEEKP